MIYKNIFTCVKNIDIHIPLCYSYIGRWCKNDRFLLSIETKNDRCNASVFKTNKASVRI